MPLRWTKAAVTGGTAKRMDFETGLASSFSLALIQQLNQHIPMTGQRRTMTAEGFAAERWQILHERGIRGHILRILQNHLGPGAILANFKRIAQGVCRSIRTYRLCSWSQRITCL